MKLFVRPSRSPYSCYAQLHVRGWHVGTTVIHRTLGQCHSAFPDWAVGGAKWALAVPLVLSEDRALITVPLPMRAAPSTNCFIGGLLWCRCFTCHNTEKASQLSLVRRLFFTWSTCTTERLKLNPQSAIYVSPQVSKGAQFWHLIGGTFR